MSGEAQAYYCLRRLHSSSWALVLIDCVCVFADHVLDDDADGRLLSVQDARSLQRTVAMESTTEKRLKVGNPSPAAKNALFLMQHLLMLINRLMFCSLIAYTSFRTTL